MAVDDAEVNADNVDDVLSTILSDKKKVGRILSLLNLSGDITIKSLHAQGL